jgi:hypothetical protein
MRQYYQAVLINIRDMYGRRFAKPALRPGNKIENGIPAVLAYVSGAFDYDQVTTRKISS